MKECPPDLLMVARRIIDHLSRLPRETDTFEGILKGVHPDGPSDRQTTLLKEAAGDLVTQGLVERIPEGDGTVYRLRRR